MASTEATQTRFVDAAHALLVSRGCTTSEKAMDVSCICADLYSKWPSMIVPSKPLHCLRKHPQKFALIEVSKSRWHVWALQTLPLQHATTSVAAAGGGLPPQPATGNTSWTVHALDMQLIEVVKLELVAWGGCAGISCCGDAMYGSLYENLYADMCGLNVGHRKREDIKGHIMASGGLHAWLTGFPQAFKVSPSGVTLVAKSSLSSSATSALAPSLGAAIGTSSVTAQVCLCMALNQLLQCHLLHLQPNPHLQLLLQFRQHALLLPPASASLHPALFLPFWVQLQALSIIHIHPGHHRQPRAQATRPFMPLSIQFSIRSSLQQRCPLLKRYHPAWPQANFSSL